MSLIVKSNEWSKQRQLERPTINKLFFFQKKSEVDCRCSRSSLIDSINLTIPFQEIVQLISPIHSPAVK